ncbi:MAG: hypothetical protein ACRENS_11515, partial [Candidatus Eiseniibacteriota bacterium]
PQRRTATVTHPRQNARRIAVSAALAACLVLAAPAAATPPVWSGYAGNPQHTALSTVQSQPLNGIIWHTPVDLYPQYSGTLLYVHYGSPMVTAANTVLVPVKTTATGNFRVEARRGSDGSLMWQLDSDYILPASSWTPVFGPAITAAGRLYMPAEGGTLIYTDAVDNAAAHTGTRIAFYGTASYTANPSAYVADVKICTPLTTDASGNVFFGYRASGVNPLGLTDGIARIAPDGTVSYVTASAATTGDALSMALNAAPVLSNDGQKVYVSINLDPNYAGAYLVSLNSTTLATLARVRLIDAQSGYDASVYDVSSASPIVGPDGHVFYGVFEYPYISDRGWALQYDADLNVVGFPGGFGWDTTPSIVPASMVPSYAGTSSYLLMCKYNNYAGAGPGGDGVNQIAILDPNDSRVDPNTLATIMKEVLIIAGVTPDLAQRPTYPDAVREWCINSAVVDPATHSVLANSEDGRLYRWDLTTNSFTESVTLTSGIGEAYTPTMIAADGRVYAINNATLFAVGAPTLAAVPPAAELEFASPWPNPSAGATHFAFSLAQAGAVRLEIIDLSGRRVATLIEESFAAGPHQARWGGLDDAGRTAAAGIYFARLQAGPHRFTRRIALTR